VVIFTLEKDPVLEQELFPGEKQGRFKYVHLESTFHELYPSKRIAAPTLSNLLCIGTALARERPDVVHCTADAITLQFGLAAKLLSIPVVTSIHTGTSTSYTFIFNTLLLLVVVSSSV
jgi:UDP-N-acetylglucosamine:LPS N-acetylglucosamine transferase